LEPRKDHVLLHIQNKINKPTEEYVYEAEPHQHKHASEDLCKWGQGSDVSVAYGTHGNYTEVKSIDHRVGLDAGEMVPVERVNGDSDAEVHGE